jgi:hypothetical protein
MKERTAIKALKVLHLCAVENFVESQDTTTTKKRERRRHNFMAHLQALLDRERERDGIPAEKTGHKIMNQQRDIAVLNQVDRDATHTHLHPIFIRLTHILLLCFEPSTKKYK